MEPETQTRGSSNRRLHWKRWALLAVVLALLGIFGRFAYLRITRRPTPRLAHWAAVMAGLDPAPPGAITASVAEDLLSNRPWESDPAIVSATRPAAGGTMRSFEVSELLSGRWDLSRPDCAAVDTVFRTDAFKAARSKMDKATRAGWQHAITPSYSSLLPWAAPARQWCRWLAAHARWTLESGSDLKEAAADWLIALRLARQVRRTQAIIPWMVEAACTSLVANEMMFAAPQVGGRVDVPGLAREVDAILGPPPRPRDIVIGEYLVLQNYMEEIFVREGGDWIDVSEAAGGMMASQWGAPGAPTSRLWNLLSPLFHSLPEAQQRLDRHFARYDACTNLARCEEFKDDDILRNPEALTALDGIVSPPASFARGISMCYRARCNMDAALAMLAIEAFRHRNGHYPERLDGLVPRYLPRLPIDGADHKPLRYRREGDRYILYSIGSNGRDDDGKSDNPKRPVDYDGDGDAVFTQCRRSELDPK